MSAEPSSRSNRDDDEEADLLRRYIEQTEGTYREQLQRRLELKDKQIERRRSMFQDAMEDLYLEIRKVKQNLERSMSTTDTYKTAKQDLKELYREKREEERDYEHHIEDLEDERMQVVEELEDIEESEDIVAQLLD